MNDLVDLQQGFAQFVAAARELERSYDQLKRRAAAVDLELQATNRALQQSLAERDAMFAALPIGLVMVRADGSVGAENREAARLRALASEHDIGLLASSVGEVEFGQHAVRVRRVDMPEGCLVLLEDRSRLQELEREVRRLNRLAGLSELALGVAHEIKNPLNGVMGFASLLQRSADPAASQRFAGRIVEGVREIDGIVKGMLAFARPGGAPRRAATVAEVLRTSAAAVGLPPTRLHATGAVQVAVDAEAAARVFDNLLRNALDAAPDVTVRVEARERSGMVELTVTDDGPGVPAALAQRVFEPFVSSKERGTGLGLALSARVLAFLGGDIRLANAGEPGACFLVRLPIANAVAPREATA